MNENPLKSILGGDYSKTGNIMGFEGSTAARLSDEMRLYTPIQISGTDEGCTQWVVEQVLQDLARKNLVVLRDPKGLATAEIIARLDKSVLKNIAWLDLDNRQRLIKLPPFPARSQCEQLFVPQWQAAFLSGLRPLSRTSELAAIHLLQILYAISGEESNCQPSLTTFWELVVRAEFREYLLSRLPTAFWSLMPTRADLKVLQQEIGPQMAEVFAVNHWRGMLADADAPTNPGWLRHLSHAYNGQKKQVGFISITGAERATHPLVTNALNFGLWRKIAAWQTIRGNAPVFAYSLAANFYASPALKPLLLGAPAALSVTCAHNRPEDWLNYDLTGALNTSGMGIAFENSRGARLSLKRNTPLAEPNYVLARISRKYSAMLYGRKDVFCLEEQQSHFGKEDQLSAIYAAMGENPPHFARS